MGSERNRYERFRPRMFHLIGKELAGAKRVLDVGCGRCELCCYLARRLKCEVVGVDLNEEKLQEGRTRAEHRHLRRRVRCEKADVSRLDAFPPASFDAAVSVYALHEIARPVLALRSVARALKPRGKFVVVDFPSDSEAAELWHEAYYTPGQAAGMMARAGLDVLRSERLAGGHLMMLIATPKSAKPSSRRRSARRRANFSCSGA